MRQIDISEAKSQLPALLDAAINGAEIIITRIRPSPRQACAHRRGSETKRRLRRHYVSRSFRSDKH